MNTPIPRVEESADLRDRLAPPLADLTREVRDAAASLTRAADILDRLTP